MPCAFHLERPPPFEELGPGCQFDVPEGRPVKFGLTMWCPFHLPMVDAHGSASEKTAWNEEKVQEFNEAIFVFIDKAKAENRPADLTGVVFPGDISFDRYRDDASALPAVTFFQAHFSGHADFEKARFSGVAGFDEAQFGGYARFGGTRFGRDSRFDGARFNGNADFREAQFRGNASFEEAVFSGDAGFEKARFSSHAFFKEARFSGDAWFLEARFSGRADFSGAAALSDGGNGEEARGLGDRFYFTTFAGARFSNLGYVRFTNRRFLEKTDFTRTVFGRAPEFHNCILHQDTVFPGEENFQDRSGEAAPAYRTLKLAMEQLRARDEEAMFHALELECRRKHPDTPLSVKVFSLLYEWAADYGRSFMRPLCRLLGFYGVFFLIYLAAFTSNPVPWDIPITWDIAAGVGRFTVAQVVRPFSAFTLTEGVTVGSESVEVSFGLACLAALQSIVSLGLIALFILALRRRFRMG